MKEATIITSKNYRQLDGSQQNELIRKLRTVLPYKQEIIASALFDSMAAVEFCHQYPELVKITKPKGCFELMEQYTNQENKAQQIN